jgi:hypothetical protein
MLIFLLISLVWILCNIGKYLLALWLEQEVYCMRYRYRILLPANLPINVPIYTYSVCMGFITHSCYRGTYSLVNLDPSVRSRDFLRINFLYTPEFASVEMNS